MSRKRTISLALFALFALFSIEAGNAGTGKPVAGGVECSYTCHCARQLQDCDPKESQWEICLDIQRTVHPTQVASCGECRKVADAACRKRICPPDPAKGPKFVFQHFCDGAPQPVSTPTAAVGESLTVSPSVALPVSEEYTHFLQQDSPVEKAGVTCTFGCACLVATGMCDDHEARSRLCADKQERTEKGASCMECNLRAYLACIGQDCPIVARTTKVLTRFSCQAGPKGGKEAPQKGSDAGEKKGESGR